MVAITLRADLTRGLTNGEIDANMTNLKAAVEAAALSASWAGVTGKPTTVAGYGITDAQAPLVSGSNIKTVNNQSVLGPGNLDLATGSHNHDAAYLGKTAKAADSELLDGFNSTAFLRSVNGSGPDANGNVAVNVDLSSRVAKTGDTMSGTLTLPAMVVSSTAPQINMQDTDGGYTRYLHVNGGLMGFLKSDGNWDMYMNNGGSMWTANYGWLHDYFFRVVANCAGPRYAINCYGSGNIQVQDYELLDEGGQIRIRTVNYFSNCNCNCSGTCCFPLDTLITLADGTQKRVQDFLSGDKVLTAFGDTSNVLEPIVCGVSVGEVTIMLNKSVRMTREHLLRGEDGWFAVDKEFYMQWLAIKKKTIQDIGVDTALLQQLKVGDKVLTNDGLVTIEIIERIVATEQETLMSIELDGDKTFFANGFAVESKTSKE